MLIDILIEKKKKKEDNLSSNCQIVLSMSKTYTSRKICIATAASISNKVPINKFVNPLATSTIQLLMFYDTIVKTIN